MAETRSLLVNASNVAGMQTTSSHGVSDQFDSTNSSDGNDDSIVPTDASIEPQDSIEENAGPIASTNDGNQQGTYLINNDWIASSLFGQNFSHYIQLSQWDDAVYSL